MRIYHRQHTPTKYVKYLHTCQYVIAFYQQLILFYIQINLYY